MTPAILYLEQHRVEFELLSYEHQDSNQHYADEASQKLGLPPEQVFKTLVVECQFNAKTDYAVAILPSSNKLSMKKLAKQIGAKKTQMADAKKVQNMSGYVLGGVSPFAQKRPLDTVVDISAMNFDEIYVSAGKRGLEIKIAGAQLQALLNASVIDICAD